LQDSGERLELQRPDEAGTNGVLYITVDAVRYNDKAPWPSAADGSGASLQRKSPTAYGNDPINWEAALPTPGVDSIPGQPPTVTAQPQHQTIVAHQDASFGITASGTPPLYYQWLFNGDPISGATNSSLMLRDVQLSQAGSYTAVVFNDAGSVASEIGRLTVHRPPTILSHPVNQLVRAGAAALFAVNATGNGTLRYQWRHDGVPLAGATSATLTISNVQSAHAGAYSVVVTDNTGPVTSDSASLVLLVDPLIVQQPLSQTVVAGSTVTLSLSVTNTANLPIGYRLRRNGQTVPGGSFTLAQPTAFFTVTNVQPPFTNYTVVVTNLARPIGLLSAPAFLTIVMDSDGDGLSDAWETAHGLNSMNPLDSADDQDGDGMLNWQEYIAGTDPTNSLNYLKIDDIEAGSGSTLAFGAISNRTYSILYSDDPEAGTWSKLLDLLARPTNRVEFVIDPDSTAKRFYRIATPYRP
jgi:hypothetical protein